MMWRELMDRNKFHSMLFDELPNLDGVTLCGLDSSYNMVELFFDLPTPINHLPKKWKQQGISAVREMLVFFDVNKLSMCLDSAFPIVDGEIQDLDGDGVRFIAHGRDADLEIIAHDVSVRRPIGVRFAGDDFRVS